MSDNSKEQRLSDDDLIVIEEQSKSECDEIKQRALDKIPKLISELRQALDDLNTAQNECHHWWKQANHGKEDERKQATLWFAEQMNVKLQENAHKGGWGHCKPYWLLDRLKEEVVELEEAMDSFDSQEVIREAADVGNFAMMIADKCRLGRGY